MRAWLERAPGGVFTAYATLAAFSTYFCMYAFRKPFAAASFEGETFAGTEIEEKTAFVISQIVGYAISKFLGIKLVSEVEPGQRARRLVALIVVAELALLLFAVLPGDLKVIAIFCNGLPLGMVWGMVVRYLEGRRTSDAMLAGLCCSFILASGAVKDVGRWLMRDHGVSEAWMPVATGALFLLPFVMSVWLLDRIPPPTAEDIAARTERKAMNGAARRSFLKQFFGGLSLLLVVYFFFTAFRDYRDNYGVELFAELGYGEEPTVFTQSELAVAFGVLVALALINLAKSNRRGLVASFAVMIGGAAMMGIATLLLDLGVIDGLSWMIAVGLGSYLVYVPYNSVLFERLVASTGVSATAVFTIYVADALGYTGSVGAQVYKDLFAGESSRLAFFELFTYGASVGGVALLGLSLLYFLKRIPA